MKSKIYRLVANHLATVNPNPDRATDEAFAITLAIARINGVIGIIRILARTAKSGAKQDAALRRLDAAIAIRDALAALGRDDGQPGLPLTPA